MLVKFCISKSAQKTFDSFDNIAQGNRHKNIKSVLPKCFVTRHPIFVIKTSNYNLSYNWLTKNVKSAIKHLNNAIFEMQNIEIKMLSKYKNAIYCAWKI